MCEKLLKLFFFFSEKQFHAVNILILLLEIDIQWLVIIENNQTYHFHWIFS